MKLFVGRAPGRLDLMGGNGDYSGGLVFQATIREGCWAAVALRDDDRIVLHNPQVRARGWSERVEFRLGELTTSGAVHELANREPGIRWTACVIGAFFRLKDRIADERGADVYLSSEVPLEMGVSSSAALAVSALKTIAAAYGFALSGIDLAEEAQWVENVIAGAACGIMDQMAVVLGDEGCILPLRCQPHQVYPLVRLQTELACWAIDSGVRRAVAGIEYETARAAAFMGYRMICDLENLTVRLDERGAIPRYTDPRWNGYLANLSPAEFRSRYEGRLPETITGAEFLRLGHGHADCFTPVRAEATYRVRANTRYAVEENARVERFADLAGEGVQCAEMGELMYRSHQAYSECGLGCEATECLAGLVRDEGARNGLFGARISGGGAGGVVAVLGRASARDAVDRVVRRYSGRSGIAPRVFEGSSPGADRFGVRQYDIQ